VPRGSRGASSTTGVAPGSLVHVATTARNPGHPGRARGPPGPRG